MPASSASDRGGGWVLAQSALMVLVVVLVFLPPFWPRQLSFVGIPLAALGAVGFVWSARALGKSMTPYPRPRETGELIEKGPYRFVRHPIYAAGFLFFLGVGLSSSVPATLGRSPSGRSGGARPPWRRRTSPPASPSTRTTGAGCAGSSHTARLRCARTGTLEPCARPGPSPSNGSPPISGRPAPKHGSKSSSRGRRPPRTPPRPPAARSTRSSRRSSSSATASRSSRSFRAVVAPTSTRSAAPSGRRR